MAQATYFGPEQRLFGVYHPPARAGVRHTVLICAPLLEEGTRAHWVLKELAGKLAELGIGSLRFHFSGQGNSLGEVGSCSLATWTNDLERAATYLRSLSPVDTQLSVFAPRFAFGLVGASSLEFNLCCAWDPLTRASHWKSVLEATNTLALEQLRGGPRRSGEFAGYDLSSMSSDLENDELVLPKAQSTAVVLGPDQTCADLTPITLKNTLTPYTWAVPDVPMMYLLDVVDAGVEAFQEGLL